MYLVSSSFLFLSLVLTVNGNHLQYILHSLYDIIPEQLDSFLHRLPRPNDGETVPSYDVETQCEAYVREFSKVAANFTGCIVEHARPVKVCLQCMQQYLDVYQVYEDLERCSLATVHRYMDSVMVDYIPGMTCKDRMLAENQTQIVVRTFHFVSHTWANYHCDQCYESYNLSTAVSPPPLSNATLELFDMTNRFGECLFNISMAEEAPIFSTNLSSNASACRDCLQDYKRLNIFYNKMIKINKRSICLDLQASMNNTHKLWSEILHCSPNYSSKEGAIVLSCVLATLPIIFYVANRIHRSKIERILVVGKRLDTTDTSHIEYEELQQENRIL